MALTIPTRDLQDAILGAMGAPGEWLNQIASFDSIPGDLPVGTVKGTYLTDPTAYTVAKGETNIRGDGGASSTANFTTVQKYIPVEFYDNEVPRMTQTTFNNIKRKVVNSVMTTAGTTLIDAISDAALAQYTEIYETDTTRNNFAAGGVAATQSANLEKLEGALAYVTSVSDRPWMLAHPTAGANIRSYSKQVTQAVDAQGALVTYYNGVRMFGSKKSGTAAKWGAAAKPCVICGCNDGVAFGWQIFEMGDQLTRRSNGLLTLEVSITYSYGLIDKDNLLSAVYNSDYTP